MKVALTQCMFLLLMVSALGGENGKAKKGPLASLPSKPGAHLAKVKALSEGKWLNLGKPKPDPKWGPAWGRAYTPKMAYASDLEGAFINGQGVHGYVKKSFNRVMDDTWFYDVNAHAWVCCYPGTHLPTIEKNWKVNADGFLVNTDGDSPPITGIVHGYNSLAYSPKHKKFITWHGVGYSKKHISALWKKTFPDRAKAKHYHNRQHPYFYDAKTGRWTRDKTSGKGPGSFRIYGANCEWLPTKNAFALYLWGKDIFLYDPSAKKWEKTAPEGSAPSGGYEGLSCFDSKRNRIYCFGNKSKRLGIYDVAGNKWIAPKDDFNAHEASGGGYHTNAGIVNYDAANDVVVAFLKKKGAYVFDCETLKWVSRKPLAGGARKGRSGFYSPKQNAHYFFDAGDSRTTPGNIWVWRYKQGKKK